MKVLKGEMAVEVSIDKETSTAHIKAENPLVRERSRRLLKEIVKRDLKSADKIRDLLLETEKNLSKEVKEYGNKATDIVKIGYVSDDIKETIGKLKFRLSYSQNPMAPRS
jgi:hypothetical protein